MPDSVTLGRQKVTTASLEMTGLRSLMEELGSKSPLHGVSMLVCVTPTPETGVFLLTLHKLGAKIAACSDNAYATDDDVVAYLRSQGIVIFAESNMTQETYFASMEKAISHVVDDDVIQIADDGCDITQYILKHYPSVFKKTKLITEQTTCGINFLRNLYDNDKVPAPSIDINHCYTKQWFDNKIGIQQSLIHGLTVTGISLPGKSVTVFGYGPLGQGAAQAAKANGAQVAIVEKDIILLMQAEMEGYTPISAKQALQRSDICLTATGCIDTISGRMIERYAHDGLILGNVGHGSEEYAAGYLELNATKIQLNKYIDEFKLTDGRKVYSLCKGALVNFIAGGGNMPRIMSLTFSLAALAHIQAAKSPTRASIGLHRLDKSLEYESAARNFGHLFDLLYRLDEEQEAYMGQEYTTIV